MSVTVDQEPLAAEQLGLQTVGQVLSHVQREACDLLQRGSAGKAMEKLSGCFTTWHAAQESVLKTAQLLRIDLAAIRIEGQALADMLAEFTGHLREIRSAL